MRENGFMAVFHVLFPCRGRIFQSSGLKKRAGFKGENIHIFVGTGVVAVSTSPGFGWRLLRKVPA